MPQHVTLDWYCRAFSGERYPVKRRVRVHTRTGAVEVWDPRRQAWTADHSLTESEKRELRVLAETSDRFAPPAGRTQTR